jgi:hypothetical protein
LYAVHVTDEFVPKSNELPDCGEHVMDVIASVPPAVALYVDVADGTPVVGDMFLLAGQEMVGGAAALTVMVNEQEDVLLAKSVAEHVTVVDPVGNSVPDAYVHDDVDMPEPSDALNVHVAVAPLPDVGCKFMDAGHCTVGLDVSYTNTRPEQDFVSPALSVATHVYGVYLYGYEPAVPASVKLYPDTGLHTTDAMPDASVAVGVMVTSMPGYPAVVATEMSPPVYPPMRGQVIEG